MWSWDVIQNDTTNYYATFINNVTDFPDVEIRQVLESWVFRLSPRPFSWTSGVQNEILDIIMRYKGG